MTEDANRTEQLPAARASVEEVISRVFLTPRVVDQRALDELGGELRALVREAAEREGTLRAVGAEVKAVGEALRESVASLRGTLEGGAKLDEARVEEIARAAGARAAAEALGARDVACGEAETLERLRAAHAAVQTAADESVLRVTALAKQIEGMCKSVEERVQSLIAAENSAREAGVALGAALAEAERRAQTLATGLEASLADYVRRVENAREVGAGVDAEAERLREIVEQARHVGDALNALCARADAMGRGLAELLKRGTTD
jgi:hypothetical protein